MNKPAIRKKVLDFTIEGVEKFLSDHPGLEFYAFAYDCTASMGEIRLCFNTEAEFQKTLYQYQNGKYAHRYQSAEGIRELRYNTGDWEYAVFDSLDVMTRKEVDKTYDELNAISYNAYRDYVEELQVTFCESLIDFTRSETYKNIPKTADFAVFCFDHDEHPTDSDARLERVRGMYVPED